MLGFDFLQRTRFVCAPGAVSRLGVLAKSLMDQSQPRTREYRAFVVSDPGVVAAGIFARGKESLEGSGWKVCGFHELHENPSTVDVDRGVQEARSFEPDLIVGLGGGSSMDCAKGINFLYSCGGKMQDYWGQGKATRDLIPMIAIPTTSGTGSESQSYALISDADTHTKMACGDPRAASRIAILDPELTLTQPPRVTALTGIDALTHAIETAVTNIANSISRAYSQAAWQHLAISFRRVLDDPKDLASRTRMQIGASLAGMAIESSMLGAAHSLANPLTARYGIPHGQAVGAMMPFVILKNSANNESLESYRLLWHSLQAIAPEATAQPHESFSADKRIGIEGRILAGWMRDQLLAGGMHTGLRGLNIPENDIPGLAQEASQQWTARFNPIAFDCDDFAAIYREAY
jgi:alcohol dehydrogenase